MSKALFFNALPDNNSITGYDRNYNADDISEWLSVVWENGVCKTNTVNSEAQGLKVLSAGGMNLTVNAGRAAIKGKAFINPANESFILTANGTAANRYDYIVLKYDNSLSVRDIKLELRTGTSVKPTAANLTRTGNVYELMLAYITVAPSATSVTQSNITDTRGNKDLCPWFTAIKGYDGYYDAIIQAHESTVTLSSASTTAITDLPSNLYSARYSLIEVYTNGLKEPETAYTVAVDSGYIVITFTAQKAAGAKITVKLDNFIDGEGMVTALAQYTALVQEVANLKTAGEYNYICNGVNDNVLISNIVKTFLQAGNDQNSLKLNVIGNIGMTAATRGEGTNTSRYGWFDFEAESHRRAIIDFTRCGQITPPVKNGTYNIIFHSNYANIEIKGATIVINNTAANTTIRVNEAISGVLIYENCRFSIEGHKDSYIATAGTFNNCRGLVSNLASDGFCFHLNNNVLLRVNGGEYRAYCGATTYKSGVIVQSGLTTACILNGVNAPTVAKSGYYQTNSLYQWGNGGYLNCHDLVSALPIATIGSNNNITGTIPLSLTQAR